ncbi:MAG: CBS domain-containing protein [Methanobrevibacter sp.]|jgi:CBS domain-containing protein|nr:CBS domain-containing protein [Candidatus Methanovirga basalitermitum]
MNVKNICSHDLVFIDKDRNICDGLRLMRKKKISRLLVINNNKNKLVGIVTEKGIAIKLGSLKYENLAPSHFHISTVMTKDILSVEEDTNITDVAKTLVDNHIGGVPVYSSGELFGIVTKSDLIDTCKGRAYERIPVEEIMTKDIISLSVDDRLVHARRLILDFNIGRVLIKDEDELVGVLTSKDIANAFISLKKKKKKKVPETHQKARIKNLLVKDAMTSNLEKINSSTSIAEVADKMLDMGFNGLPVVNDENEVIGLVTKTDLLSLIIDLEK